MDEVFSDLPLTARRQRGNDICQAPVVYQNPSGIESFNHEHNDQWVVIRLFHSSNLLLRIAYLAPFTSASKVASHERCSLAFGMTS